MDAATGKVAALDEYRELLPRVLEEALEYLEELPHRPVRMPATGTALHELLDDSLPLTSTPAEKVLEKLLRAGALGVSPTTSPRYFGYVMGGTLPVAVAADWMTSAWDQCGGLFDMSPLTGVLEEICGKWLVEMFELPSGTSVAFTPACTYSNILSLTAARYAVLDRHGWDVREHGLQGAPAVTVLANSGIHASVLRALNVLGLGVNVRRVATDDQGRIRLDALDAEIAKAVGTPLLVCGQVGELHSGAIEFMGPLCDRVHAAGGWVHVDAAFGLWAAATDRRHTLFAGLEKADSWSTDAHKWLNVPYESGIAFISNKDAHRAALAMSPDYLQHDQPQKRHSLDWGLGMSTRSRVIPIWAALTQLGRDGIAQMIDRHCAQARHFADLLAAEPGITIINDVVLNQLAVRFHHPAQDADTHTQNVADAFQEEGIGWAQTSLFKDQRILRLSITNWSTTDEDIDRAAESLLTHHRRLIHQGNMTAATQALIANYERIKKGQAATAPEKTPQLPPRSPHQQRTLNVERNDVMSTTTPDKTALSTIRLATPADRDNVIGALTAGFSEDIVFSGWLFDDPDTYDRYAAGYFACYTDFAIEHGYVWTTGDPTAALITMPFSAWQRAQTDPDLKERIIQGTGPFAERAFALDEVLIERHPMSPDHLYLALIGIQPEHRGGGLGTRLLQAAFDLADRMGIPCYGESSCDRNGRLYDRIGLPRDKKPLILPGSDLEIYPLWRPASGALEAAS